MESIENGTFWGIPKRKVWVAKHHHDLVSFVDVMQSIVHDIHLTLWLKGVASDKKSQSQMQLKETGVGSDEVNFIL